MIRDPNDPVQHTSFIEMKVAAAERFQEALLYLLHSKGIVSHTEMTHLLDESINCIPENVPDPTYKEALILRQKDLLSQAIHAEHHRLLSNLREIASQLYEFETKCGGIYRTTVIIKEE
ncbi:hypothetical protein HZX00_000823 [Salmonella enterica]|nr:hypothetical protein [Salmonella enterica]